MMIEAAGSYSKIVNILGVKMQLGLPKPHFV